MSRQLISKKVVRELVFNNLVHSSGQIVSLVVGVVTNIVLARALGPSLTGAYIATQSLVAIVYSFAQLGLRITTVRFAIGDLSKLRSYFGSSAAIRLGFTLPVTLFASLLGGWLFGVGTPSVIVAITVYTFVTGFAALLGGAFEALNQFQVQARVTIVTRIATLGIALAVLSQTTDLVVLLLCMAIPQFVATGWFLLALRVRGHQLNMQLDGSQWRLLIMDSIPLMLASSAEFINFRADSVIMDAIRSEEETGFYSVAYDVYRLPIVFAYTAAVATFPTMVRYFDGQTPAQYLAFIRRLFSYITLATVPIVIGIVLLGKPFITIAYGNVYDQSYSALYILAFAIPFAILNRFSLQALNAAAFQRWTFIATFVGAGFNVLINLVLVPRFGMLGASTATVLTEAIVLLAALIGLVIAVRRTKEPAA